jgi:hypothetical protein
MIYDGDLIRVARAGDFGQEEFAARDWIFIFARPDTITGGGIVPSPGGGNPLAAPPIPPTGQWVQVAENGAIRWVPLAPFACPV